MTLASNGNRTARVDVLSTHGENCAQSTGATAVQVERVR